MPTRVFHAALYILGPNTPTDFGAILSEPPSRGLVTPSHELGEQDAEAYFRSFCARGH